MITKTLTKDWVSSKLPKRPKDAHKGTFGKVMVVAGSENYPGAAYLSCAAAYRVGAGLITLLTNETAKIIVSKKLPEVTFIAQDDIFEKIKDYDVILLGPGLGQKESTFELVKKLLGHKLPKAVIDADGLNIISKMGNWPDKLKIEVVLTPHPGEMARLTGLTVGELQADRINITQKFARIWNRTIVLKGANTVIVYPDGEVVLSPFANPALATAGTGDVLSGIITGLIAQGLKTFEAACCGVYIHGMAGEEIKEKMGDAGALASDLLPLLPGVLKKLKQS